MNSGSFVSDPVSQDQVLVTIALALVAILAVLTVIAMLWGARLRRRRKEAEAEEEQRIADLKADGVTTTNASVTDAPMVHNRAPAATPTPAPVPTAPDERSAPAGDEGAPEPRPLADEPIAAAAPLDATPASVAADAPAGQPTDDPGAQPVTMLKGLGPRIAARMEELGITRVDQLAWLDDAEAAELDRKLDPFQGRMERDRWREQARLLAQGDRAGYEAQFGRIG